MILVSCTIEPLELVFLHHKPVHVHVKRKIYSELTQNRFRHWIFRAMNVRMNSVFSHQASMNPWASILVNIGSQNSSSALTAGLDDARVRTRTLMRYPKEHICCWLLCFIPSRISTVGKKEKESNKRLTLTYRELNPGEKTGGGCVNPSFITSCVCVSIAFCFFLQQLRYWRLWFNFPRFSVKRSKKGRRPEVSANNSRNWNSVTSGRTDCLLTAKKT